MCLQDRRRRIRLHARNAANSGIRIIEPRFIMAWLLASHWIQKKRGALESVIDIDITKSVSMESVQTNEVFDLRYFAKGAPPREIMLIQSNT